MKRCYKCRKRKNYADFYKQAITGDGYTNYCKECIRRIRKQRYKNNTERLKKYSLDYYYNHKDRARKRNQENWQDPIKKAQNELRHKRWFLKNKEYKRKKDKEYYSRNKDKYYACGRRRRAKKLMVNEDFTTKQAKIIHLVFDRQCFNCRSKENLSIDHFKPLSRGHALTLNNAILLCRSCNSSKGTKKPEKFFNNLEFRRAISLMKIAIKLHKKVA